VATRDEPRVKRVTALLAFAVCASTAFADDDPDLLVVSGRVAADRGTPVRVRLDRRVARSAQSWSYQWGLREAVVPQGEAFRFAGLPPGRYDLVVEGEDVVHDERTFDVFDDIADLDVRPTRTAASAAASLTGRLTLGFEGAAKECRITVGDAVAKIADDGAFAFERLHAGPAWIDVVHSGGRWGADRTERYVRRRVLVELKPGANHVDVPVTPNEDVRVALRSKIAGEPVDGSFFDLDASSTDRSGDPFRVVPQGDGTTRCYELRAGGIDSVWWQNVGATLPLLGLARGEHRVRIEALGFEPVERAFTVDGPTRVDVELTPLHGQYVRLTSDAPAWFVDERRADGSWAPLFTRDERSRSSGSPPRPDARVFLAPGVHVLRAATPESPPSDRMELKIADDRTEIAPSFALTKGATLTGRLVTKAGTALDGFDVRCFRLVGERWERVRAQDAVAGPGFKITGLAPGRHRLAFDAEGKHVFAEFDMGAEDVEREFTFHAR